MFLLAITVTFGFGFCTNKYKQYYFTSVLWRVFKLDEVEFEFPNRVQAKATVGASSCHDLINMHEHP